MSDLNGHGQSHLGNGDLGPSSNPQKGGRKPLKLSLDAPSFDPTKEVPHGPLTPTAVNNGYLPPAIYDTSMYVNNHNHGSVWSFGHVKAMDNPLHTSPKAKYVLDPQALHEGTSEEHFMRYSQASSGQNADYLRAMIDAHNEIQGDYIFLVAFDLRMIPLVTKQIIPLTLDALYDYFITKNGPKTEDFVDTMELLHDGRYIAITHHQIYVKHSSGVIVPTGVYRRPEPQDPSLHQVLNPEGWVSVRQLSIDCLIEMGKQKAEAKKIADAEEARMEVEIRTFGQSPGK